MKEEGKGRKGSSICIYMSIMQLRFCQRWPRVMCISRKVAAPSYSVLQVFSGRR